MNSNKKNFWQEQLATCQGMMLNESASEIDELEQKEIISYLPDIKGKKVLELGAGIGRYTKYFAASASWITAVDFVEKFIENNKINNSHYLNITYCCRNVMDIELSTQAFDFVFINWLLMYLENEETEVLIERIHNSLKSEVKLFLRESCVQSSNPKTPHLNTHYRCPEFYQDLLLKKFSLLSTGNIFLYEKLFNNPNQIFWLVKKNK